MNILTIGSWNLVSVGGGPVGSGAAVTRMAALRCQDCGKLYPMALDPVGLAMGPRGATVLAGFVEVCPRCHHSHLPGDVLGVEVTA